MQCWFFSDF